MQLISPFQTLSFKSVGLLGLLGVGVLGSSVTIVYLKYQTRILHAQIQMLEKRRSALNVEWSQLLLEKSACGSTIRAEQFAHNKLNMSEPTQKQIRILKP